ncbi:mitochondrial transcription rescue factor 1 [Anopheles nili]|uniref:mitochondrial transcription rescue factor 1 n=1 Tax=Anopheles nili TaxID=185578 RepID=UPI00237A5EA8|nr:mitochondrial transcription rescue factor 1 [Anopheles nili]
MMSISLRHIIRAEAFTIVRNVTRPVGCARIQQIQHSQPCNQLHSCIRPWSPSTISLQSLPHYQQYREKSKKSGKQPARPADDDLDDDDDREDTADAYEDLLDDKLSRNVKTTVNSMRADLLLKAGLGIARNKVEALFYDSKIRVNGKKLLKKSAQLEPGDEIDVVRGPSPSNPEHLVVSRVEILSVTPRTENLAVSLRRHKSLVIENYTDSYVGADASREK